MDKTQTPFEPTKLIEAVNRICLYVSDRLPDDWEIVLRMSNREATLELLDPEGMDQSDDVECGDGSALTAMCDYALDAEAAKALQAVDDDVEVPVVLLDGLAEISYNASASARIPSFGNWEHAPDIVREVHEDIAKAVAVEILRRLQPKLKPAEEPQPPPAKHDDNFVTVADLKRALNDLPDDMPVFDRDYESDTGSPYSHVSQILQVEDVAELDFQSLGKSFHFGRRDGLLEHTVLREFKVLSI